MSTVSASSPPDEITAVETAGRGPLLLLFGWAVVWLLLSGVLEFLNAGQGQAPALLADCPIFNYGRTQALGETAFVYGWLANAGLGLALWILARLAGEPLRTPAWIAVGAIFWNLAVAIGLIAIAVGEGTALPFLELPRYVQPLMLAAYAAIGLGGVLAWTGRRRETMFASQWYAVAALFLFPWLLLVAQVMLLWFPVPGVVQAIAGAWFAQGLWTFWIAPFILGGAYYLVPKLTGRTLQAYEFAPFGFWCLLFIGGWSGSRHLIGGPVPAWINNVGIVTTVVMLFHYVVVGLNLRPGFALLRRGGLSHRERPPALKFIVFGVTAYLLGGLVDAATAIRGLAVTTQFTYVDRAQEQLAFYGAASMVLFGALYYAVPRLAGRPWFSGALRRAHFALAGLGVILLVGGLAVAGWTQGRDLNDAAVPFAAIAGHVRPALWAAVAGQGLLLLGNLLLALNFFKTVVCPLYGAAARLLVPEGAQS